MDHLLWGFSHDLQRFPNAKNKIYKIIRTKKFIEGGRTAEDNIIASAIRPGDALRHKEKNQREQDCNAISDKKEMLLFAH